MPFCGAHPHLNRAVVIIFIFTCRHAHLHRHRCAAALIFILAPSRSSLSSCRRAHLHLHCCAATLITFFAPSHSSSSSRCHAHLHCCAIVLISSLRCQALHLHCAVELPSFIVVPSRALLLCCHTVKVTHSVYRCAIEVARSVHCRAVEFVHLRIAMMMIIAIVFAAAS